MFQFDPVTIQRKSQESLIRASIRGGDRDPDLKKNIKTPLHFLNHMIEQWAWRSCMNLAVEVQLHEFVLHHVIAEDTGQCFGEALLAVANQLMKNQGINGHGTATGFIDEAAAAVRMSFEYRSGFYFQRGPVVMPERVEDMLGTDLGNFLGGIAQGARATLHVDLLSGEDPHHIWESVFRGLGEATRQAFSACPWRKGQPVGVAGFIEVNRE
ncbi:MAG TPA: hypothetical protein PK878_01095 [bacterium]|nr:hypothetical protein [bacterium]HOL95934.1 hypothetical protein [bacterium]HPO99843.1 hypothetical protein [bacterium]HXK92366.1 hypothetical protein [bacterium]